MSRLSSAALGDGRRSMTYSLTFVDGVGDRLDTDSPDQGLPRSEAIDVRTIRDVKLLHQGVLEACMRSRMRLRPFTILFFVPLLNFAKPLELVRRGCRGVVDEVGLVDGEECQ